MSDLDDLDFLEADGESDTRSDRMRFLLLSFSSRLALEAAVCALRMIENRRWHSNLLKRGRIRDDDILTLIGLEQDPDGGSRITAKELRAAFQAQLELLERKLPRTPDGLAKNLEKLGKMLKLSRTELGILRLGAVTTHAREFNDLFSAVMISQPEAVEAIQAATGLPRGEIIEALANDRALRRSGFLENYRRACRGNNPVELNEATLSALSAPQFDENVFLRSLVRIAPESTLSLDDYAHMSDLPLVQRYIADAVKRRRKGVNVLLHGAPGTGKTEFVRALASALDLGLYEVPNEDEDGDSISGRKRFIAYAICQNLLANRRRQALLFDEVEDVFGATRGSSGPFAFLMQPDKDELRKSWVNQTLEENPVPAFWVSNSIGTIDAAYLRRFDLILEFAEPPRSVRRRIVDRYFRPGEISTECADQLAELRDLTPAHVARVARVSRSLRTRDLAKRDAEAQRIALASLKAAGLDHTLPTVKLPTHYDPAFLNTDFDLAQLASGLRNSAGARLCLYGRPGTGKTAFAHHLGQVLDRPVLVKHGSDLLGMFLGQTEAQIANAFREAREENAILVIDEADSFLRDRKGATRQWEVTQVNELLTQMESFDGIFIASTNLIDMLDEASLRRFDFKIRFDYLSRDQRRALVAKACAVPVDSIQGDARTQLDRLDAITPGDVTVALRQCKVTGQTPSVETLVRILSAEQSMKPDQKRRPMGFAQ